MMIYHILLISFVCLLNIGCVIQSLFIPWVRPVIPVSRGLYEINVPMDIGLLKCYSPICQKFPDIENFLFDPEIPVFAATSDGNPEFDLERSQQQDELIPSLHPSDYEQRSLRNFLVPFKRAAISALLWLSVNLFFSLFLVLVMVYELFLAHFLVLSHNLKNVILLFVTFSMFLSLVFYLVLSYSHLHNGTYIDGAWLISYTSVLGLLSCLLLNILDNHFEIERLHESVAHYYQTHPAVRPVGYGHGHPRRQYELVPSGEPADSRLSQLPYQAAAP